MKSVSNIDRCTGCGACVQVCPVQSAISLAADREGFCRPTVTDRCVACGACRGVCPALAPRQPEHGAYQGFYGARHTDPEVVRQSSSGGAFTALAREILRRGGVVYGVVWQEEQAVYRRAEDVSGIEPMRGSKYIQPAPSPELDAAFLRDAAAGIPVLFTGLSCKVAGMRRLLAQKKISAEQVWFVDFICAGVISPLLWKKEWALYQQQYGAIRRVNFRDKRFGWRDCGLAIQNDAGRTVCRRWLLTPMGCYQGTPEAMGTACEGCRYAGVQQRQGDITLAEYWNARDLPAEWKDDKGLSLLATTPKGEMLLQAVRGRLVCRPAIEASVQKSAHNYGSQQRHAFWEAFEALPYTEFRKIYGARSWHQKLVLGVVRPILLRTGLLNRLRGRR